MIPDAKDLFKQADGLRSDVKLRPHQEDAVAFLKSQGGRALFAHGVGSGKTLSAIAGFEELRKDKQGTRAVVVVPASLKDNFINEGVKRFTTSSASPEIDGKSTYQVVSLDKFRRDPLGTMQDAKADSLIIDELHRAKNSGSVTAQAIQDASFEAKNVIGLTGSVVSNHPREVITLLDAIDPQHAMGSVTGFAKRYTKKDVVKPGSWFSKPQVQTNLTRTKELRSGLQPYVHYVGNEEIGADYPTKKVEDVSVQMSDEQNKLYGFALGKLTSKQREMIRNGLPSSQQEAQEILTMLLRAREASNAIHSHKNIAPHRSAEETPKLKRVMDDVEEHLKNTKDGQAVIFTHFVESGADALRDGLKRRGHDVGLFAGVGALGEVTEESRHADVKAFKAGEKKIIILTPAATEGISLNNATAFFEVDRHYNPEKNNQAIARAWRMGGQAHRPKEKRELLVKRYYSEPQTPFLKKLLGQREFGVDQWIQRVADEKDRLNAQFRDVVKKK